MTKVSRNAARFTSSLPSTSAGSGMPQWASTGWPGKNGQLSFARSQTVITKSHRSWSSPSSPRGVRPVQSMPASASTSTANGLTRAAGREPALAATNRPPPLVLNSASAIWLRAELPVQRIRMRRERAVSGIGALRQSGGERAAAGKKRRAQRAT